MRLTPSMELLLGSVWAARKHTQGAEAQEVLRQANKRTVRVMLKNKLLALKLHADGGQSLALTPLSEALMGRDGEVDRVLLLPPYKVRMLALFASVYPSGKEGVPSAIGSAVWPGYRRSTSSQGYGMKAATALESLKRAGLLTIATQRDSWYFSYRITERGLTALRLADDAEFVDWTSDGGPRSPGKYWYRKNRGNPALCLVFKDGGKLVAVTSAGLGSTSPSGRPIKISRYGDNDGVEWSFTEAKPLHSYRRPEVKKKCPK